MLSLSLCHDTAEIINYCLTVKLNLAKVDLQAIWGNSEAALSFELNIYKMTSNKRLSTD